MFSAILIHDNITIAPSKFDRSRLVVLMEEINLKYANKVIPHVGLCVRLLKVESVGEAQVFPSDGSAICEGEEHAVVQESGGRGVAVHGDGGGVAVRGGGLLHCAVTWRQEQRCSCIRCDCRVCVCDVH